MFFMKVVLTLQEFLFGVVRCRENLPPSALFDLQVVFVLSRPRGMGGAEQAAVSPPTARREAD